MARKRQKKTISTPSFSDSISIPSVSTSSITTSPSPEMSPEQFMRDYANTLYSSLQQIRDNPYYTPQYANSLMKDINIAPYKPSSKDIENWLIYPQQFEQQLSSLSQYLEGVVMQYERVLYHFASNLDFNYYIYPITSVPDPKDKKAFTSYKNSKKKALEWLRKFRLPEQLFGVTLGIIREGGKFYYIRESSDFVDYQEMPSQYSIIDGRTSLGYTYSFNMSFFLKSPQTLSNYASEFMGWFDDFYADYKTNKNIQYNKQMPPEKSVVFLFDDTKAARLNPLRSLFKDALDVQEYKKLLKTKTLLDTWKLIYMKSPLDKDGKPSIDQKLIAGWIATAQASLPFGAVAFGSPLEASELKVADNQFINILGSQTNSKFWENAGVSSLAYGSSDGKSVAAIKASNITDMQFVNHLYRQYMKNINFQLSQKTGSHKFAIKIFGDSFSRQETVDKYRNSSTLGVCKKEYLASLGKEPFEYEMQMSDIDMYNWDTSALIPLSTSYTMSGSDSSNLGGAPPKSEDNLSDAGAITRDHGSNIDKVTS